MSSRLRLFFVDTSFLVAFYNDRDGNHKAAKAVYDGLFETHPNSAFITTDYVFDEFVTLILRRGTHQLARRYGRAVLEDPTIKILYMTEALFNKTWDVFTGMTDKGWSFTDCFSYLVMRDYPVDAGLSFDKHFRQFGFTCLP